MSARGAALRIGVIGATGALGSEVLALLSESSLDVGELVPLATDHSLGQDIEFRGAVYAVETQPPRLRGLDLVFLCAPAPVCLEFVRQALREEVPCVDAGGALAGSREVPLQVAAFGTPADPQGTPLLVAPPAPALALALALRPLEEAAGLHRVVGTCLDGASWCGRQGIETLFQESIALFNQQEPPEPEVFSRPVAFDCVPAVGEVDGEGTSQREAAVSDALVRLLADDVRIGLTSVQIPIFVGFGAALAVETRRPLDVGLAEGMLGKAPGVERWDDAPDGATLRAAAGRSEVLVGRVRRDPSLEQGLLLWLAADVLRLAAANAVRLAVGRLGLHH
jgi:aspartate-semialdehyde dehydrogenase